eukprot:1927330-Heterocapsa_arctica.AAC.1
MPPPAAASGTRSASPSSTSPVLTRGSSNPSTATRGPSAALLSLLATRSSSATSATPQARSASSTSRTR